MSKRLKLDDLLDEFKDEMRAKFFARAGKHKGGSVTDDDFDWVNGLSLEHIEAHRQEEIRERNEATTDVDRADEDVDVSNTHFLDWAVRRAKQRGF